MVKRVFSTQTDVKVNKETATPNGATLSLEAMDRDRKPVVSSVDIVKENGAWKITAAVEAEGQLSRTSTRLLSSAPSPASPSSAPVRPVVSLPHGPEVLLGCQYHSAPRQTPLRGPVVPSLRSRVRGG